MGRFSLSFFAETNRVHGFTKINIFSKIKGLKCCTKLSLNATSPQE